MHALALTLTLAAVLTAAPHIPPSLDLSGGVASPITSFVAWDKGGSADWGSGIRSPDIDCAAVGTSSAASLQCSGATPSFAGPGQVAAGSPWWYRGDSAVRPSIALNGSTDWWGLGAAGAVGSAFAVCVAFDTDSVSAAYATLVSRYTANNGWWLARYAGTARFYVCDGTDCSGTTQANIAADQYNILCSAYIYSGTPGTSSTLRANINGTALADVTNARGPVTAPSTDLVIGKRSDGLLWAGGVRRVAIWTGADAPTSAAQLAQMVATQNGLAHDKPAGTVATHARSDSTLCCPFSDAECYWVGPGAPCIHAPTYQGWASGGAGAGGIEVYGVGANALAESRYICNGTSFQTGWNSSGAPTTCTAGTTTGPWGTALSGKLTYTASSYAYASAFVATAAPYTLSCWMKADAGSPRPYLAATPDNTNFYARGLCPVLTPTWQRCTATGTMGTGSQYMMVGIHSGDAQQNQGVAGTIWVEGCQATPTAYPVPYRATTGSPYSGTASTATTLTVPVASGVTDAMGAVAACFQTAAGSANKRVLSWTATTSPIYFGDVNQLYMYDSANFTGPAAYSAGSSVCARAEWSGTAARITNITSGTTAAGTFDGSLVGTSLGVGCVGSTGLNQIDGLVSRTALCSRGGSTCR